MTDNASARFRAERCSGCPAVLGVFRPKVILPVDFEFRYTRLERLLVFSHERTHLRRGDAVWNAVVALVRCLLWFNPLVHLASNYLREDQEFSSDAAVVAGICLRTTPRQRPYSPARRHESTRPGPRLSHHNS